MRAFFLAALLTPLFAGFSFALPGENSCGPWWTAKKEWLGNAKLMHQGMYPVWRMGQKPDGTVHAYVAYMAESSVWMDDGKWIEIVSRDIDDRAQIDGKWQTVRIVFSCVTKAGAVGTTLEGARENPAGSGI